MSSAAIAVKQGDSMSQLWVQQGMLNQAENGGDSNAACKAYEVRGFLVPF